MLFSLLKFQFMSQSFTAWVAIVILKFCLNFPRLGNPTIFLPNSIEMIPLAETEPNEATGAGRRCPGVVLLHGAADEVDDLLVSEAARGRLDEPPPFPGEGLWPPVIKRALGGGTS